MNGHKNSRYDKDKIPIRKMTNESRTAALHQKRETALRNLRECTIRVNRGNSITEMDTLFKDQVNFLTLVIISIYPYKLSDQINNHLIKY